MGYKPDPYLPLKWLPQGVLPLLFSSMLLTLLPSTLSHVPAVANFLHFMVSHPASALVVGVSVGVLQVRG